MRVTDNEEFEHLSREIKNNEVYKTKITPHPKKKPRGEQLIENTAKRRQQKKGNDFHGKINAGHNGNQEEKLKEEEIVTETKKLNIKAERFLQE